MQYWGMTLRYYSAFTETGATQTMKTNQKLKQNWNNRFLHFQIQPIKCPVQNNEISTCPLTGDVYIAWVPLVESLLLRRSKKALQMVCEQFHSNNFRKGFFKTRKYSNPTDTLTIYIYEWHSYTILVF